MVVTVDLTADELSQLQTATGSVAPDAAVTVAARQFLRIALLKQLKNASGNVEFDLDWRLQESMELGELPS